MFFFMEVTTYEWACFFLCSSIIVCVVLFLFLTNCIASLSIFTSLLHYYNPCFRISICIVFTYFYMFFSLSLQTILLYFPCSPHFCMTTTLAFELAFVSYSLIFTWLSRYCIIETGQFCNLSPFVSFSSSFSSQHITSFNFF